MPGPHYAISEALIVIAAIWAGFSLAKSHLPLAAIGIGILGMAAAIGVFRFGFEQIETLASLHRNFSQIGGAIAMGLIASQMMLQLPTLKDRNNRWWLPILCVGGTAVLAIVIPRFTTGLFTGWLAIAMLTAAVFPGHTSVTRFFTVSLISVFLFNVLLIRQTPSLGADLSWHIFHVLIAIWLIGIVWVFDKISGAAHK
ncbi:hypothetical protein [Sphingorhabdus sp. EL138]|jgi:hypothetical protein|uniref:hypothetical protein n=1 Tax=Sphingorhabdus sp. EL138 TaxID=2073156 RepID=UPI000D68D490|nr:hypothetical protein [Sphingorhabdus sp. EL138]